MRGTFTNRDQIDQALHTEIGCFINTHILHTLPWDELSGIVTKWLEASKTRQASATTLLPIYACQTIGGDPLKAVPLAAYWALALLAARIFDDVQDGELLDRPWNKQGPLHSISFGTAALAAANLCLTHLDIPSDAHLAIAQRLQTAVMIAARAQSIVLRDMQLETYFSTIVGASGMAFGAIAWAGGRLATNDKEALALIHDINYYIGIRDAVRSDCLDAREDLSRSIFTLPVVYATTLHSHPDHKHLMHLLFTRELSAVDLDNIISMLNQMNAFAWCYQVSNQYQERAVAKLRSLDPTKLTDLWCYVHK